MWFTFYELSKLGAQKAIHCIQKLDAYDSFLIDKDNAHVGNS